MSEGERAGSLDPNLAVGLVPSIAQRLLVWQESSGYRLDLDEWLTTGNTKAKVAVVLASGPKPPSKLIIKACPPDRLTAREPRLHSQALAASPSAFATEHLVSQPFDTIESEDKWRILFQSIAGDSLRRVRPLAGVLHDDRLPRLVGAIARPLLVEWNATFNTQRVKPHELLYGELGSKVDRNGPLRRFSRENGLIGFDSSLTQEQSHQTPSYGPLNKSPGLTLASPSGLTSAMCMATSIRAMFSFGLTQIPTQSSFV